MMKVIFKGSDFSPYEAHSGGWGGPWQGWREVAATFNFFVKTFTHHGFGNASLLDEMVSQLISGPLGTAGPTAYCYK